MYYFYCLYNHRASSSKNAFLYKLHKKYKEIEFFETKWIMGFVQIVENRAEAILISEYYMLLISSEYLSI